MTSTTLIRVVADLFSGFCFRCGFDLVVWEGRRLLQEREKEKKKSVFPPTYGE